MYGADGEYTSMYAAKNINLILCCPASAAKQGNTFFLEKKYIKQESLTEIFR